MSYAIDLTERQSVRTLEQAIRHQVPLMLEPRAWSNGERIPCRLQGGVAIVPAGRRAYSVPLVVVVATEPGRVASPNSVVPAFDRAALGRYHALVGTYCDVTLHLGQNRYLFSTDVLSVEPGGRQSGGIEIHLSRPSVIQVAQRRRFRRIQLPQSAQVEIRWRNDEGATSGGGWSGCTTSARTVSPVARTRCWPTGCGSGRK